MSNRTVEFLKELSELTKKYGVEIVGCGCCGSPWLDDTRAKQALAYDLSYNKEKQVYESTGEALCRK